MQRRAAGSRASWVQQLLLLCLTAHSLRCREEKECKRKKPTSSSSTFNFIQSHLRGHYWRFEPYCTCMYVYPKIVNKNPEIHTFFGEVRGYDSQIAITNYLKRESNARTSQRCPCHKTWYVLAVIDASQKNTLQEPTRAHGETLRRAKLRPRSLNVLRGMPRIRCSG